MFYRRTKVERSTFRNIPFGQVYYLSDTSGPFVKMQQRRATLVSGHAPTVPGVYAAGTAVSDTSVAVQKVGKYFLGQRAI
jgi:hypothetical protein